MRLRHRVGERADVGEDGELAAVEERAELGHRRMDTPGATVVGARRDREDGVLREGECAAARGVGGVGRVIRGNDEVVRVVAAGEEKADKGFVVGGQRAGRVGSDGAVVRARDRAGRTCSGKRQNGS